LSPVRARQRGPSRPAWWESANNRPGPQPELDPEGPRTLFSGGRRTDHDGMRIGLIAPPWLPVPPRAYGGTEAVIDRLARGFVRAGHDVLLAGTGDSTCPVPLAAITPRAVGVAAPYSELDHVRRAYDAVDDCDIVHDHTLLGPEIAADRGDTRVVTTNHGRFAGVPLERYVRIADRIPIIAISHAQAAEAPSMRIASVIHHGLDVDRYPNGDGRSGYFVFLGRMARDKGVHRAAWVARAAGVRLVIAAKMSEPAEVRYFRDEVEPLLGGDIVYVGEVREREKLALLAGARALVNPIRWVEPFGLVMIEALACGTPVLAFAEGAAPEIVDHGVTGYLCRDEADMVARIDHIATIDRDACRGAVQSRFSTARMVSDHLTLFDALRAGTLAAPPCGLPFARSPGGTLAREPEAAPHESATVGASG
jgi:glycosyltransferase involved in cell wall biosynthesis